MRRGRFARPLLYGAAALGIFAAAAYITREWWLTALGQSLIEDNGPAKADVAVLLAGDYSGLRMRRAAELVRGGYVGSVLVSGPQVFYGAAESDMAIGWAARQGYPREWFVPVVNYCTSTACEARLFQDEFEKRRVASFLLVTSDFHTGRAARLFRDEGRRHGASPAMRTVAAYGDAVNARNWWRSREGRKAFFFEFVKTMTSRVGL